MPPATEKAPNLLMQWRPRMIGAAPPKRGLPAFPNGEGANLNQTTPIMGRKVGEDSLANSLLPQFFGL